MESNDCRKKCDKCATSGKPEKQEERRTVLSWLLGGGAFASILSFLYPVARFLNPPRVAEAAVNEADGGKAEDMKPNSGKIVKFGNKPALLMRVGDNEWKAISAVCTHLNCTVQYRPEQKDIWCACHGGTYDMTGRVTGGPPPKSLEEYAVNLRGEQVMISRKA